MNFKKMSKLVAMFLVAALALSSCSSKEETPAPAGDTTTENTSTEGGEASGEVKDIKVLSNVSFGKDDAEMALFEAKLSEVLGANVTIERPASDYDTVLLQKLQAGEQYDLVYLPWDYYPVLASEGSLTDLTDMVANSPVLSDESIIPASEWSLIELEGKKYAGFNKKELHKVVSINKVLADQAGIDVTAIEPTLDGYYEMFTALKAGVTTDGFYPLNISISKWHDLQPYFAATNTEVSLMHDGDKVTAPITDEASIPVWEWLAKLYAEGLLDPNCFVDATGDMRNKFQSGQTGVVADWAAWTGLYNKNAAADYQVTMEAYPIGGIETPDGGYLLDRGSPSIWSIPVNAENPEGGFALLEFLATQEGGEMLTVGLEGNDYTDNYTLTELGTTHSGDHGATVPINAQFEAKIEPNPGFEEALPYLEFAKQDEIDANAKTYKEIAAKHATLIISGQVDAKQGIADMKQELLNEGIITE